MHHSFKQNSDVCCYYQPYWAFTLQSAKTFCTRLIWLKEENFIFYRNIKVAAMSLKIGTKTRSGTQEVIFMLRSDCTVCFGTRLVFM